MKQHYFPGKLCTKLLFMRHVLFIFFLKGVAVNEYQSPRGTVHKSYHFWPTIWLGRTLITFWTDLFPIPITFGHCSADIHYHISCGHFLVDTHYHLTVSHCLAYSLPCKEIDAIFGQQLRRLLLALLLHQVCNPKSAFPLVAIL